MKDESQKLPVHSLNQGEFPFSIQDLAYKNPYDHTREHRHTYFEVFLLEKGGGSQLIDFLSYPLRDHSAYIVFPRQIHLVKRKPESAGSLVQFSPSILPSPALKLLLDQYALQPKAAVIFENDIETYQRIHNCFRQLQQSSENSSPYSKEICLLLLQTFLYQLLEINFSPEENSVSHVEGIIPRFRVLLEEQFRSNRSVRNYAEQLGINDQKLAKLTKIHLGMSPLQVIHDRILLEIKRLLGYENESFKEIAYQLGFDSPAAFSQFVKSKTGKTPTGLREELVEIHK